MQIDVHDRTGPETPSSATNRPQTHWFYSCMHESRACLTSTLEPTCIIFCIHRCMHNAACTVACAMLHAQPHAQRCMHSRMHNAACTVASTTVQSHAQCCMHNHVHNAACTVACTPLQSRKRLQWGLDARWGLWPLDELFSDLIVTRCDFMQTALQTIWGK